MPIIRVLLYHIHKSHSQATPLLACDNIFIKPNSPLIRIDYICFSHGDEGLTVHFNLHLDPAKGATSSEEVTDMIRDEIGAAANATETDSILGDIVIDADTLQVHGETEYQVDISNLFS